MRIDVLTIFPELIAGFLKYGIVERARRSGSLEVRTLDIRAFTNDRYHAVDDRPYGGGPGMLIKPEPVFRALDVAVGEFRPAELLPILLCPAGELLQQERLEELAKQSRLLLLAGRYEGFDQRVLDSFPWRPVSVGEFVLSGGEVPAMVLIEGIARLLPGVLGHPESNRRESFSEWAGKDGFDHPHFTRPQEYRGRKVPEVLASGDHKEIETWRRRQANARKKLGQE